MRRQLLGAEPAVPAELVPNRVEGREGETGRLAPTACRQAGRTATSISPQASEEARNARTAADVPKNKPRIHIRTVTTGAQRSGGRSPTGVG